MLEKGEGEEGTRVVGNAARNHYEPLRSALGAFVAETTFIGNCNLLLEGQADQVLLVGVSSMARRSGRTGDRLDLNTLSLVPAGSAEHIPYLTYLARGRDVDTPAVIVLLDSDKPGDDIAAELQKGYRGRTLVDPSLVIQVAAIADEPSVKTSTTGILEMEDLIPAEIARSAVARFASEVLPADEAAALIKDLPAVAPNEGEKLFQAAQRAAVEATAGSSSTLRLDKVGFARAVLHVLENDVKAADSDQVLDNFEALFQYINKAQRNALRQNSRERTTKTLNRLRRSFLKDHPASATRRDVEAFLEDIDAQLIDGNAESETLRAELRRIRHDFKIADEPLEVVDDFEALRERLESLTYAGVREVQTAN